MKLIAAMIAASLAFLLFASVSDLPEMGDPLSTANNYVAKYYIEHAIEDGHVPNVVTSVLADYRGFDTMFETGVVLIAGIAIMAILLSIKNQSFSKIVPQKSSTIVTTAVRFMVPLMQLFALYVVAHGHHSPGGGFQGGVILGASVILLALGFGLKKSFSFMSKQAIIFWGVLGVFVFAGIGLLCMFYNTDFLDYGALANILPYTDHIMARSHGMLGVEIGVAMTVMSMMFGIYAYLSTNSQLDEGL